MVKVPMRRNAGAAAEDLIPRQAATHDVSVADLLRALFRHKFKAAAVFVAAVSLAVVWILVAPREYRSEAQLYLGIGRESALDPTVTTGGAVVAVRDAREAEITSAVVMLRSRALAEEVVNELGEATVLEGESVEPEVAGVAAPSSGLLDLDPVSRHEKAVARLADSVHVEAVEDSNVVAVTATAKSPRLAQKIVETLVGAFEQGYSRVHQTPGSLEFFDQQCRLLQDEIDATTQEFRDAKNRAGLTSLEGGRAVLGQELSALQARRSEVRASLAASEARIEALEQTLEDLPPRSTADVVNGLPDSAVDNMRAAFYSLQMRESELASQLTDDHPSLKEVRRQLAEADRIVQEEEQRTRSQETASVNPSWQQVQMGLLEERARRASLSAEEKTLSERHDLALEQIKSLNESEPRIEALKRQLEVSVAKYHNYLESREQARIDHALHSDRISNVSLIQPATLVEKPTKPKALMILAGAMVVGLFGSFSVVYFSEYEDDSLKTIGETEQQLHLPVLASLPQLDSDQAWVVPR